MKKMRVLMAGALMLGVMTCGAGVAVAADNNLQAVPASDMVVQAEYAQPVGGYVEILEVGEDYLLVKPEAEDIEQLRLNIGDETLLLNNKEVKRLRLADFDVGNRIYAYYAQAMTRSLPPQSHALALLEVEENETPARLWVAEYVEADVSGDLVMTTDNGGLLLRLPTDKWELANQVKADAPKLAAGDSILAWYEAVALSYPGQATANRVILVEQAQAPAPAPSEQVKDLTDPVVEKQNQNIIRPATATTTIKEIVNTADERYIIVDLGEKGEHRLNFGTEGEDVTLLVDGQTGIQTDWADVKPGDKVMVNYGPQTTFSLPPQSWLHYMLVNLGDEPPVGLYQSEEQENPATNVIRILTDGGGLWITVNIGEAWPAHDGLPNKLAVGDYFLAWYDEVAESYPGQTTATKVREYVTADEQADKLADKAFDDKYCNEYKTTKLVCGKVNAADYDGGVHYHRGVTMVPLRAVAEELGWTVDWDAATRSAVITNGEQTAKVTVDDRTLIINGEEVDWGARIGWHGYGVCVPAPLFEELGAKVTVAGDTMTISK